jgi:hypothetical protein
MTRIITCVFAGNSNRYAYYSDDETILVDDYVVVVSPNGATNHRSEAVDGFPTIVKVVSIEETLEGVLKVAKPIVCKINLTAYAARLEHDRKVEVLKAKIHRARKEAMENIELAKLAVLSPELGELVKEMAALTGVTIEEKPIPVRAHRRKSTRATGRKGTASTRSRTKK